MLFEGLAEKIEKAFKSIRSKGKLSKADVEEVMREIKLALLSADVNFTIVRQFVQTVTEKAVGEAVMESLNPAQMVVKIVCDELTELLGGKDNDNALNLQSKPSVVMLLGLQGVGKTTTAGKLASLLKKQGKKPLLVACDVYRPAAIEQLRVLAKQIDVPFFSLAQEQNVITIAKKSVEFAKQEDLDVVILDTAGRLDIDEKLINELISIKEVLMGVGADGNPPVGRLPSSPTSNQGVECLLIVDSLSGQVAVDTAKNFNEKVGISGLILTKLDSDSRGGAALSAKSVTGVPIKFAGIGEKLSDFEVFYPERMAKRILGMGDMLTLIEKAQEDFDIKEAKELQRKLEKQEFDFNDYLAQLKQIKKMGGMASVFAMMPANKALKNANVDESRMVKIEAIINSMTPYERTHPDSIKDSRKKRISKGSGTTIQDINTLLKQHKMSKQMMKSMTSSKGKMKFPWG